MSDKIRKMNNKIIIIDLGSYTVKVGRADKMKPQFSIRSVISDSENSEESSERSFFGKDALQKGRESLLLVDYKYDIMEIRWSKIFEFFHYIFEEKLGISASELQDYRVVFLIGPMQPRSHFIRYYKSFFSQFTVANMLIISATRVALLASRNTTGVVVDIGHKSTRVVPFYEGFRLAHAYDHQDLAGKDIDEFDENILEYPIVPKKDYHIPTSEMIAKVIERCDEEVRDELYSNIIFSGWWSANKNIISLIQKRMQEIQPPQELSIVRPTTQYYNWTAAAQLSTNHLKDIAEIEYLSRTKYESGEKWESLLFLAGFKTRKWGLISYPL